MLDHALMYVSGKGGAGKTTVAAGLGLAAAGRGRRVLVCEVERRVQLPRAFGVREEGHEPVRLTEGLWFLSIDPERALDEWLRRQPGGALVAGVLTRSTAFGHFVAAAPGAKELITLGKIVDLAQQPFDLVVVDAPATGHALGMLAAPRTLAAVARIGPVGEQARALHGFLTDATRTRYVGVSLPEEMSVREVVDLERGLHGAVGRTLDLIVVDGCYPERFSDEEVEQLESAARRHPSAWAIGAALSEHRRARSHAEQVDWVRRHAEAPVVTLPFLFVPELAPRDLERLGRDLAQTAAV
jgi:Anion-transporting ATPase